MPRIIFSRSGNLGIYVHIYKRMTIYVLSFFFYYLHYNNLIWVVNYFAKSRINNLNS